jgi:hypothetical protein
MSTPSRKKRGQAVIMLSLATFAMCGMMGLAVDLGWAYFVKKSAQAAADSAALAVAGQALAQVGPASSFLCDAGGGNVHCQSVATCASTPNSPPQNNIDNGCLYAQRNGFRHLGHNNRQDVTIEANTTTPPPTAPGVFVDYWATVRVSESIPQLFSFVLGNRTGMAVARATAAVLDSPTNGSIYTINRQNDPSPNGTGNNIYAQGGGSINANGAIYMASSASGSGGNYAGHSGGSSSVSASNISIRGAGSVDNTTNWTPSPVNNYPDSASFMDPMKGKGQPPILATGLNDVPVLNGSISGTQTLTPGRYYAVDSAGRATGAPLQMSGNITFSNNGGGFGTFILYGGVQMKSPGSVITFAPGEYVLAGTKNNNSLLEVDNGIQLLDNTSLDANGNITPNTDAGELFVFTDLRYPGLPVPSALNNVRNQLQYGNVDFQQGNTSQSAVVLHGLNVNSPQLPDSLKSFAPTVFWQDQKNSSVLYRADGTIDTTSCGDGHTIDSPCANTDNTVDPDFHLQAYPNFKLYGLIYQPRGANLDIQAHGTISTPLTIITGSLSLQGSPMVMQALTTPLQTRVVALVE